MHTVNVKLDSLAGLKREMQALQSEGGTITVTYWQDGRPSTTQRTVLDATNTQVITDVIGQTSQPVMHYGQAKNWEFDNYIAGRST